MNAYKYFKLKFAVLSMSFLLIVMVLVVSSALQHPINRGALVSQFLAVDMVCTTR